MVFGSTLFANTQGGRINLHYLNILEDLEQLGSYSWGSVMLSHLYKCLDNRVLTGHSYLGGCVGFLMLWSFEYIAICRPIQRLENSEL
ncbi:hypothetical protein AMTR_s00096p00098510 [Amborella trichopoda]|uniref:Aminotransferase-like plant mobile domain-containing protein n=1 Tax=Amborella trichopoda TaxID=13333 RepID=W1P409_AMBTC|nr:hypothetical protein AMTR_s00096p00098510 [Amborella trichopoda]